MVGVIKSLEEAAKAKMSGADCILIKREMLESHKDTMQQMAMQLQYLASGDD